MRIPFVALITFSLVFTYAQDSSSIKDKLLKFSPEGNISVGYEYGLLPFVVNSSPPNGNFKTNGNILFKIKDLPFQSSFYYSTLGTISGLNNYFTIKFDSRRYKQDLLDKLKLEELNRIKKLDSLQGDIQNIKTKLDYLYLVKDRKIALPVDSSKYSFPNKPDIHGLSDSLLGNPINDLEIGLDSLNSQIPDYESLDSLNLPTFDEQVLLDSLSNQISSYQEQISGLEKKISELQNLNNLSKDSLIDLEIERNDSSLYGKVNKLMQGVKHLDFGLTYPNYSEFLISRIPVRGINLVYEKNKFYLAATHGKTVNNIFITNNIIQNNLNAARNLYNFFDFSNIDNGRRITAVKLGYGAKEGTHLHIGVLNGLGKVNYRDTSNLSESETNWVGELEAGVKIRKAHFLEVNYGRSTVQANNIIFGEEGSVFNSLLDFTERTNALLGRYNLNLKSVNLKFTYRYIDPFFRSFGVGFLRSDNVRYELKYKQKLGKKLSYNLYFRRENDNLLNIYNYENILLSYGLGIQYRPTRHLLFKADIRPINLDANNSSDSLSISNDNIILNGIVNYNNRVQETYFNLTAVYSYYKLSLEDVTQTYQNINATFSIENKNLNNLFIANFYQTTDTSSVPLTSLLQNEFTYKKEKFQLTGILKASFSNNIPFDFGYGGRLSYQISKNFSLATSAEKLVIGDFYNSLYNSSLQSYPFRMSYEIIFRW